MSAVIENHHDDHHHGPAKGITRWLYTTNHTVSYTHLTLPTMS